jgi:AbiV family abortive infection protein
LKNKNNEWVEILEIKEELWTEMMREITLNRIPMLLDCAEKLMQSGGNEAICAGLYTYAIEEYGKFLLLKKYSPIDGKVQIRYNKKFRNHHAKFGIAVKNLPQECSILHKGIFDPHIFAKGIFDEMVLADLEARLAIFYSDFTDSAEGIKSVPSVDKDLLQKAIQQFKGLISRK